MPLLHAILPLNDARPDLERDVYASGAPGLQCQGLHLGRKANKCCGQNEHPAARRMHCHGPQLIRLRRHNLRCPGRCAKVQKHARKCGGGLVVNSDSYRRAARIAWCAGLFGWRWIDDVSMQRQRCRAANGAADGQQGEDAKGDAHRGHYVGPPNTKISSEPPF